LTQTVVFSLLILKPRKKQLNMLQKIPVLQSKEKSVEIGAHSESYAAARAQNETPGAVDES
jgi:hypothetical protein